MNKMTTYKKLYESMEKLIESLDKKVSVKCAATGTLYVEFQGKKIRISDHEPNYAMRGLRGEADLELYTHDLVGKEINSKYDIVEKVADFLNLEITGATKAAITRFRNKEIEKTRQLIEWQRKHKAEMAEIQKKIKEFHSKIRQLTKGKEKEIKQLFFEAEKYGDLGSNGDRRRKRRVSYFKREFKNRFGIEAKPADVETALQTDFRSLILKKMDK